MMLVKTKTGLINCGDPIPASDTRYVLVPYPANSDSVLNGDANENFTSIPRAQAGPQQWFQVKGNFLEYERSGAHLFLCVQGLA